MESYDREKILQMVIDKVVDYKKENEEEYSLFFLKTQINRILDYCENKDSPLSLYPGNVSCSIMADIIFDMLKRKYKERNFLSELSYNGIKYDYSQLIYKAPSAEFEEQPEYIKKEIDEFLKQMDENENNFNPLQKITEFHEILCFRTRKTDREILEEISFFNKNRIYDLVNLEKKIVKVIGLESVYVRRVGNYIKMSEIMISETLFFLIRRNLPEEQIKYFEIILNSMRKMKEKLFEEISTLCKNNKYQILIVNQDGKESSPITQFLTIYQQYRSVIEENKKIEEALENDIIENLDFFMKPTPVTHRFMTEYKSDIKLLIDLKESEKRSSSDKKKLIQACDFMREWYGDTYDKIEKIEVLNLRIVYREIFMNKVRLNNYNDNHTALYIANRFLNKKRVEDKELIFLEKKIVRGLFREMGILDLYVLYNKTLREFREMILQSLYIPRDDLINMKIRDIVEDVLNIFREAYCDI